MTTIQQAAQALKLAREALCWVGEGGSRNDLVKHAESAVDAALASLEAAKQEPLTDEPEGGCPCLLTEPCGYACTCANPFMSGGCLRCCKYGSLEQRKRNAERLAAAPSPGSGT